MDKVRNELLQGTLDLLILRTLVATALHGWDIAKRIAVVSKDRLSLKQGSLYPALIGLRTADGLKPNGECRTRRPERKVLSPDPERSQRVGD